MPFEKLLPGNPSAYLFGMALLAALPFFLMGVTSYVKLSVVFGILRNALGAQQLPSGATTSLLALVLTLHIMRPVALEMHAAAFPPGAREMKLEKLTFAELAGVWGRAEAPLLGFLMRHSGERERNYFRRGEAAEGLFSLMPAFVISQLREAFAFGFLLFLPLLVVDIVVANLLVGLGLTMVSPVTVTLPLKILLFVAADTWLRLSESLIASYA